MKIHPKDEQLYVETLARLTKDTQPLGQKHVDYMKLKLDEYFEFRASLDDSEINGEELRLRWQSQLRLWFAKWMKEKQLNQRIKRRHSFKFDA